MTVPNSEEMVISMTGDETHSLGSYEVEDIGKAAASSKVPITSEEVARQIKAAPDPWTKQLEELRYLMQELRRHTSRRSEETSVLNQDPSRRRVERFDTHFSSVVLMNMCLFHKQWSIMHKHLACINSIVLLFSREIFVAAYSVPLVIFFVSPKGEKYSTMLMIKLFKWLTGRSNHLHCSNFLALSLSENSWTWLLISVLPDHSCLTSTQVETMAEVFPV